MNDFSFGKGAPFEGSTSTECGPLTLSSKNTEPFGMSSFRNNPSGKAATVTVKFSRPIREFRLAVSYVRSDEYLGGFSVAPSGVSGTLTQGATRVSTSRPSMADDGAGTIVWSNLHTDVLTFEVGGPPGTALAMDTFMVDCDR
jgi:hypothetical protein